MSALTEEEEKVLASQANRAGFYAEEFGGDEILALHALVRRLAERVETLEGAALCVTTDIAQDCLEDPVGHHERKERGWHQVAVSAIAGLNAALSAPPSKEAPTRATTYDSDDAHPGSGRLLSASPVFATPRKRAEPRHLDSCSSHPPECPDDCPVYLAWLESQPGTDATPAPTVGNIPCLVCGATLINHSLEDANHIYSPRSRGAKDGGEG